MLFTIFIILTINLTISITITSGPPYNLEEVLAACHIQDLDVSCGQDFHHFPFLVSVLSEFVFVSFSLCMVTNKQHNVDQLLK